MSTEFQISVRLSPGGDGRLPDITRLPGALEVGVGQVPLWAFALAGIGLSLSFWRLPNGLALLALACLLAGRSHLVRRKTANSLAQGVDVIARSLAGLNFPLEASCVVLISAADRCEARLALSPTAVGMDDFRRLAVESAWSLGRAVIAAAPDIRVVRVAGTIEASDERLYDLEVTGETLQPLR